jgi:hypothetical protein
MSINTSTLTEKELVEAAVQGLLKQADEIIAAGEKKGNLRQEIAIEIVRAKIATVETNMAPSARQEAIVSTLKEIRAAVRRAI